MARVVDIDEAVRLLGEGAVVALPTETVYGLAADAESPAAVARIFAAKGRPSSHPLIVHLASVQALEDGWVATVPPVAQRLADVLWPGPLTLIFERGARVPDAVTGGLHTVGIRVPRHPMMRAVLERFGGGLAAPSANRFGAVSPTNATHVLADLGHRIEAIVDGGDCEVGIESTIVDVSSGVARILRPGAVTREQLEAIVGGPVPTAGEEGPRAPGALASHYAPRARIHAVSAEGAAERAAELARSHGRVAVLAPPSLAIDGDAITRIEVSADPEERARGLYASLRAVDAGGFDHAVVVLPDESGLGVAIADRLRKAAGPRDGA
jgi:L-threonylcarbamoyladenylate synthase